MHPFAIQEWLDELEASISATDDRVFDTLPDNTRRRCPPDQKSSPSKCQRTIDCQDPDETPTRPRRHISRKEDQGNVFEDAETGASTRSTASLVAVLTSREALSNQQAPTDTYSTTPSRTSSPTKRFLKAVSLLDLMRPVRFTEELHLGAMLSDDSQQLFEAISTVEAKEAILPIALRGHPDFKDIRIREFMWNSTPVSQDSEADLVDDHTRLRSIVEDSIASSNFHRSEFAWNCLVHTPFLRHAFSRFHSLQVEPIASAQIMPAFRPLFKTGYRAPSQPSNSSTSSASGVSGQDWRTPRALGRASATSVHNMVDFAVVLCLEKETQKLVDSFLDNQPRTTATINQTIYEPLRTRPAPIFIETKTSSGNLDTANAQLGVWVAAWHERMRGIMALSGETSQIITIPVIRVVGGVWTLLFVIDSGAEIRVLDGNLRIGDTSSILGIYQLQAAMSALADWVKHTFEPWLTTMLTRAMGS
ncbi:hypothetical protein XA68_12674 [Ophiocordyceps unilateralis]|uniref:PD-(D/E)XK nuclease-like domain-containing protein n=1 Tax=Ophiocordyceps unilateralis TaxID=268505 RepID=A0A2A9PE85_OPHUN|nr:hypothetical protein XA68_12674 [Ophiocordyceps unilateralis]